jgi:hypothetical protein
MQIKSGDNDFTYNTIDCIPVCLILLTSLLPPSDNPIAVNKYISSYHIQAHVIFPVTRGFPNEEYCFLIDPNQLKGFDYPGVRHTIESFQIIYPRHACIYFPPLICL